MAATARSGSRYHHGDLPAALRTAALELIAERGPHGFSLAEAARRAGVTVAAPYRHFTDREALLASIAVQGYDLLADRLRAVPPGPDGGARLAGMAAAYVDFAAARPAHFAVLFSAGVDKDRHPQVRAAGDRALGVVTGEVARLPAAPAGLALDLWAVAHGYAALLGDGALADHGVGPARAADLARTAAAALVTAATHGR
jgi:AcrR family transcriptional regulator